MKPRAKFNQFLGVWTCYGYVCGLQVMESGRTVGEALARWEKCVRLTFAP